MEQDGCQEAAASWPADVSKRKRSDREQDDEKTSFDALISPNFEELARRFPDFGTAWRTVKELQKQHSASGSSPFASHITQDFSIALTKALLQTHWNISLTQLPHRHLCPPVPNRYFYVHWLQTQVLPSSSATTTTRRQQHNFVSSSSTATTTQIFGLDIGTGATCIYPLLFCAASSPDRNGSAYNDYLMFATDIDVESVALAQQNVVDNNLTNRIHVVLVPETQVQRQRQQQQQILEQEHDVQKQHSAALNVPAAGPLRNSLECLPQQQQQSPQIEFCMTNPPFFDSLTTKSNDDDDDDVTMKSSLLCLDRRKGDGRERTSMTVSEGSYPGGEFAFCLDMILDTLYLWIQQAQQRRAAATTTTMNQTTVVPLSLAPLLPLPVWSSCMCGKKATWLALKSILHKMFGFSHVMSTEFGPGHMTRWFLAWTLEQPTIQSSLAATVYWSFYVSSSSVVVDDNCNNAPSQNDNDASTTMTNHIHNNTPALPHVEKDGSTIIEKKSCKLQMVAARIYDFLRPMGFTEFASPTSTPNNHHRSAASTRQRPVATASTFSGRSGGSSNRNRVGKTITLQLVYSGIPDVLDNDFLKDMPPSVQSLLTSGGLDPSLWRQLFSLEGTTLLTISLSFNESAERQPMIVVQVDSCCHTLADKKMVEKIKLQMEGEICRTNRKWRRRLKLKQQNQTTKLDEQPQPMHPADAMDES